MGKNLTRAQAKQTARNRAAYASTLAGAETYSALFSLAGGFGRASAAVDWQRCLQRAGDVWTDG